MWSNLRCPSYSSVSEPQRARKQEIQKSQADQNANKHTVLPTKKEVHHALQIVIQDDPPQSGEGEL